MNNMTLQCTGINSGYAVRMLNAEIGYSWSNLTDAKPSNTTFANVETQFNGWSNPMINLVFYIPIDQIIDLNIAYAAQNGVSSYTDPRYQYMSWELWHQFVKNEYLGTTATKIYLSAVLGSSDTSLKTYAQSTSTTGVTPIPVQLKSYSMRVTQDESRGSLWVINAQFIETI
jgi:hypothetical protein